MSNSKMNEVIRIRKRITTYAIYLQFALSLLPDRFTGDSGKEMKKLLAETFEFIENATQEELSIKGVQLQEPLKKTAEGLSRLLPPRDTFEKISTEFYKLLSENKEVYSTGVELGWLEGLIDTSKVVFLIDLPYHTRIGIGNHAGFISVEEEFLLRDAFFLLLLVEESYMKMYDIYNKWKETGKVIPYIKVRKKTTDENQNISMYSRLCIFSFYSFMEAFINSIGYDFYKRNSTKLQPKEKEILNGIKESRYLSLEAKIEKLPSIIRPDKKTPIVLSDPKQMKDPYKSFFEQTKELRDSFTHFSPIKTAIWRKPDDWKEKAVSTSKLALDVASDFWKSCYPHKDNPVYLHNLDYDRLTEIAEERHLRLD